MITDYGGRDWDGPQGILRLPAAATAYYVTQVPEAGVDRDTRLLAVLHGWGQNAPSFLRRFAALKKSNVVVVAPQAPHQFYLDMETKKVGFSWLTAYDRRTAMQDITAMLDTVLSAVKQEFDMEVEPFLLGFSQGVSIAYRYAILGANPVSGVIACGGDLPPDVAAALPSRTPVPVLLIHGKRDGIVPVSKCEAAAAGLSALGWNHESRIFDGDHDIPGEIVEDLFAWIRKRPHKGRL